MAIFTVRERTAFTGGIEIARQMALTAAVTIEVRDDAGAVRQQAAAPLQGLADALARGRICNHGQRCGEGAAFHPPFHGLSVD